MKKLEYEDLAHVVRRIPKDVRDMMAKYHGSIFLGGGFVRAILAGEQPNDIDLFGTSAEHLKVVAKELQAARGGRGKCSLHSTKNAITVFSPGRTTVQFITRWTFDSADAVASSFDFTVCQAVLWLEAIENVPPQWTSTVSERYYQDLAAKRLVYTSPQRDEEAGGSLMRVLKYIKRGYSIQVDSLAACVARLNTKLDEARCPVSDESRSAYILSGILREVDPSLAVDGLEVVDDHEAPDALFGLPSNAAHEVKA